MESYFEGLEIQKRNIPTEKDRKVDEKNGIICLVIMFTAIVMLIKMPKMLYFLLMVPKT